MSQKEIERDRENAIKVKPITNVGQNAFLPFPAIALACWAYRRLETWPDLLAACKVAVLALTHEPINPDDIKFIEDAITKAE